jgi:exonuclease SbcC
MFARFLRPKWEHADPRVRRLALESGDVPPEVLARAAREDEDPEVRRCAVQRLGSLSLLAELIGAESTTAIREAAIHRQRELLAGPMQEGPAMELRVEAIRQANSPQLCAFLARQAQSADIRTLALEQVEETEILCTVAVDDPVAAVRHAALARIEDPKGWETVARNARNRDKQISRSARERLESYCKAQCDLETAERLSVEMTGLAEGPPQAESRTRLMRLTVQWDRLESPIEPRIKKNFARAREQALARIEQFEAILTERRAICTDLEDLLARVQEDEAALSLTKGVVLDRLAGAIDRWPAVQEADRDDPLAQRFNDLVKQLRQASERLARDAMRAVALRDLVDEASAALDDAGELDEERVNTFQQRWAKLQQPESKALSQRLAQEFDAALQPLRERVDQQQRQREQALTEAEGLMSDLENALKQGELERTLSLRDRVRHRLKTAEGVEERKRVALQERLHGMHAQIDKLREWRHWGSGHARERLCSEIEKLAGSGLSATETAARVRNAREAWKRIDRAEGPAAEALWQRFDAACSQAYMPYQQERREQADLLKEHLQQKQALCRTLDEFERSTDWKNVDWPEADKRVRQIRQKWRRVGPVPRKAGKALEKTYREVLDRLEAHLGAERERELRRRRALIARVEELANAPDLRSASVEVKEVRKRWKPTVQAAPGVEQTLWGQFQAACDAFFSRISAEREAADAERRSKLDKKTALCEELATLLDNADTEYEALRKRFALAASEWAEISPLPPKLERSVEARYDRLKKRFAERRRREAAAAADAALLGMRERSRLCERLETAALENCLAEDARQALAEESWQAWQTLAPLGRHDEKPLQARFDQARRALSGNDEARQSLLDGLSKNLDQRLELCLHMEVAAGIDSPVEFAEARMQLQVSRLSDALHHRLEEARSNGDRLRDLQMAWHQTGPVPGEVRAQVEARFQQALAAAQSSGERS